MDRNHSNALWKGLEQGSQNGQASPREMGQLHRPRNPPRTLVPRGRRITLRMCREDWEKVVRARKIPQEKWEQHQESIFFTKSCETEDQQEPRSDGQSITRAHQYDFRGTESLVQDYRLPRQVITCLRFQTNLAKRPVQSSYNYVIMHITLGKWRR